jgi:ankyrin repeat protein
MPINEIYRTHHYDNPKDLKKSLDIACRNGNFDLVKYLLTNDELSKHLNSLNNLHYALRVASSRGHLNVMKFLLTSSELKENPDINSNINHIFSDIITNGNMEILKFLIFDLKIERTEIVNNYFKNHPDKLPISWFELRDLNQELIQNLDTNNSQQKKPKL